MSKRKKGACASRLLCVIMKEYDTREIQYANEHMLLMVHDHIDCSEAKTWSYDEMEESAG